MAEEEAVPEPEEKAEGDSLPFKRGKYPAFVLFFFTYVNTAIVVYSFRALAEDDWFGSLELMAQQALDSGSPANNPRVPVSDEIVDLYRRVW